MDYDAEIRRTRACGTADALAWAQQNLAIVHFDSNEVYVSVVSRTGTGATLAAAVLDCVLKAIPAVAPERDDRCTGAAQDGSRCTLKRGHDNFMPCVS